MNNHKISQLATLKGNNNQDIINRLNEICGFTFWKTNSEMTGSQFRYFSKMNFSGDEIRLPDLSYDIRSTDYIKLKLPAELHRKPTRDNIDSFIQKYKVTGLKKPTLFSRIKKIVNETNPILSFTKTQLTKKEINNGTSYVFRGLLKYEGDDKYNGDYIQKLFIEYLNSEGFIKTSDIEKFYSSFYYLPSFSLVSVKVETIEFWKSQIESNSGNNIAFLCDLISYYHKYDVNLVLNHLGDGTISISDFFDIILVIIEVKKGVRKQDGKFIDPSKPHSVFTVPHAMGKK